MPNMWLAHHGIKGQKWGVRRYQNKDGSYTAAGKKLRAKKAKKIREDNLSYIEDAKEVRSRLEKQEASTMEAYRAAERKYYDELENPDTSEEDIERLEYEVMKTDHTHLVALARRESVQAYIDSMSGYPIDRFKLSEINDGKRIVEMVLDENKDPLRIFWSKEGLKYYPEPEEVW